MPDPVRLLLDPLHYAFFVRALLASVVVGAVCATVGTFIVLRGMAFFGDALAHAILPGVALGYILGGGARGPLVLWGLIAAIVAALGVGTISRNGDIKEDTAIGVVFAGMFALGIALISTRQGYAVDLAHILFGNVLGVGPADLTAVAIVGAAVVLVVLLLYKELILLTFDPVLAATLRLPTTALYYLTMVLIAVTIVASLQTVGVALMVAMLVTPAATAFLLVRRVPAMMAVGASLGACSGVVGLYASYYLEVASGAAIVLVSTALFAAVWLLAPRRRRLWRRPGARHRLPASTPEERVRP
jgi:ABC-type Mn2+/Zn2+ transport system permease subunit